MARATKPIEPTRPRDLRAAPASGYVGTTIPMTCANCQHFEPEKKRPKHGRCHNGISGKVLTRAIDGCGYGFYPDVERYPIKAGPGGIR